MNTLKSFYLILCLISLPASASFSQPPEFNQAIYLYTMIGDSTSQIQLNQARSLSIDLSGSIYVADTGNNRILKFSKDGKLIKTIGGFGWEKEQFYSPYDIHASSALDIFVADYNNHRIERYDKDLNYISSFYSNENWEEQFQFGYPRSIASSIHGELFLTDGEYVRILKLNSFGEPEMSFGDFAEGKGRLLQPIQAAISPDDKIYVSDSQANKIIVFDYFGNYLTEIGSNFLKQPQGIFYSPLKLLFVADQGNKRIVAFKSNGDLVIVWSKISDEIGLFQYPGDVVTFQQRVFVLDNDRILVFELK
ncbi:MAG: NHL repeat-containing protein [bacterium]|nr:MAG: NHL repeat-containing protein [bacterium]